MHGQQREWKASPQLLSSLVILGLCLISQHLKKKKKKYQPHQQQNAKALMCLKCLKRLILITSHSTSASWWRLKRISGAERQDCGYQRCWGEQFAEAVRTGFAQVRSAPRFAVARLSLAAAEALWGWFGPFLCQADCGKQPAADKVEKDVHDINESFDKKEARETIVSSALFS